MYNLKNKVQLIGHLGKDPEVKTIESGKKVASFTMATNEQYRNAQGQKIEETQWHYLVAWGGIAEVVEKYLTKGAEVLVEGKIQNRTYTDKDGNKKYFSEVQVSELLMLGKATVPAA
jgi:single-strand DNA-binding protein